jgi:hypothetical protein
MEEKIKAAILSFNWGGYGMDDVEELASNDPDVGVFDDLAAHIAGMLG